MIVLPASFGVPGYVLCVAGLVSLLRRIPRAGGLLGAYVVVYYALLLGSLQLVFVRYASPIVPALAAAGGAFAVELIDRLRARIELPRIAATAALALLTLTPPALRLAQFDRLLGRPDTRDLAGEWLVSRGAGKPILSEGGWAHVHALEAGHAMVCQQELPAALWRPTPVLAVSHEPTPRGMGEPGWGQIGFAGSTRSVFWETDQRLSLPDLHAPAAPEFLAQARGPRSFAAMSGEDKWGARDPACWREAARFSPGDIEAPRWDVYDALFIPFAGFSALQRPGPEIVVYENRCKRAGS